MATAAGLDAGLLVGAQDVILGAKRLALPQARIEVQNRSGLLGEAENSRKDPVLVAVLSQIFIALIGFRGRGM